MSFYDDSGCYDLNDPKHPTFHERYADAADMARKRGREYPTVEEDEDPSLDRTAGYPLPPDEDAA